MGFPVTGFPSGPNPSEAKYKLTKTAIAARTNAASHARMVTDIHLDNFIRWGVQIFSVMDGNVLREIAGYLSTRDIVRLSSTCRFFRQELHGCQIHPIVCVSSLVSEIWWRRLNLWISRHAAFVQSFRIERAPVVYDHHVRGLQRCSALRRLSLSGQIRQECLSALPPSLTYLDINRLVCKSWSSEQLWALKDLRVLKLRFQARQVLGSGSVPEDADLVVFDDPEWGSATLASLDHIEISNAEVVSMRGLPDKSYESIDIRATYYALWWHSMPRVRHLRLHSGQSLNAFEGLIVSDANASCLETLSLSFPVQPELSNWHAMTNLQHLKFRHEVVHLSLDQLARLSSLKSLDIEASIGVSFDGTARLPPSVAVQTFINGTHIDFERLVA